MSATPSSPGPELTLTVDSTPAGMVVNCFGKITLNTTELLLEEILPLIPETKRIVLDLTQLAYLDSAGIGAMVRLWMSARKAGCEFKVRNLSPRIKDLFTMTNLAAIFGEPEQS
jgi:anti-sigma B factor antagonist